MDAIAQFVADGVLGTGTLWGGDVERPSDTGRRVTWLRWLPNVEADLSAVV
jgi:hypothetical protein